MMAKKPEDLGRELGGAYARARRVTTSLLAVAQAAGDYHLRTMERGKTSAQDAPVFGQAFINEASKVLERRGLLIR